MESQQHPEVFDTICRVFSVFSVLCAITIVLIVFAYPVFEIRGLYAAVALTFFAQILMLYGFTFAAVTIAGFYRAVRLTRTTAIYILLAMTGLIAQHFLLRRVTVRFFDSSYGSNNPANQAVEGTAR